MEERYEHLCVGCMQSKGTTPVCPHCHYAEGREEPSPLYLKPRTVLHDRYFLGKALAQGGFGVTYVGFDTQLHRKVAIKEYFPSMLAARDASRATIVPSTGKHKQFFQQGLKFFIEEARTLAKFERHPNIVNVYDFFQANGSGYMVMQFLEGLTLAQFISQKGGKLPIEDAKRLMFPILDALKTIHTAQLYHRDISPQNIMIIEPETPVLIDFGAARYIIGEQSRSLDVVMKPGYTPLEQLSSHGKIGPWTDVYACGATFYFMITGEVPPPSTDRIYRDDVKQPADMEHLRQQQISPHFNDAILRSLAVREDDRFKTVAEFETALRQEIFIPKARPKKEKAAKSERVPPAPERTRKRPPLWLAFIGLLAMGMVIAGVIVGPDLYRLWVGPQPTPTVALIVTPGTQPTATIVPTSEPSPVSANQERIQQMLMTDANTKAVIHPLEGVYYLEPNRKVVITIEPAMALQGQAAFGKVTVSRGRVTYTAPNNQGSIDLLIIQALQHDSKERIDQKAVIIQLF